MNPDDPTGQRPDTPEEQTSLIARLVRSVQEAGQAPEDPGRTQIVPEQARQTPAPAQQPAAPLSPEEENRRLAMELARRGIPPEEIQRLLSLGAPLQPSQPAVQTQRPPDAPRRTFQPHPTITLPEFRPASEAQKAQADRLLVQANIARRRGQYKEAERLCREAIEQTPADAAALELYGDILQSIGRVDDALYSYDRARTADPKRASAERKYAELTLAQETDLFMAATDAGPRNPFLAVFLSATLPGAGQVYNGESRKGLAIALAQLLSIYLLLWTPLRQPNAPPYLTAFVIAVAATVYIYAVADAKAGAKRAGKPKTGWEV